MQVNCSLQYNGAMNSETISKPKLVESAAFFRRTCSHVGALPGRSSNALLRIVLLGSYGYGIRREAINDGTDLGNPGQANRRIGTSVYPGEWRTYKRLAAGGRHVRRQRVFQA